MPSNPANNINMMRSTVFAFKCKMGTPLARIDFNLVLRSNEVKQLFFSVENNVHLVCMRLRDAITRIRFVNALVELERKPLTNFRRPVEGVDWSTFVFIGNQLREGGAGFEIKQTLTRHMDTNHPAFFQSHSTTARHITHMLRNAMRRNRYAGPAAVIPPSAPQPQPAAESLSRQSSSEIMADESLLRAPDSPAATLPVESPLPTERYDSSSSARTEVLQQQDVFNPPLVASDGQPNLVGIAMHVRDMTATSVREILQISPGFNLQATLGDLNARVDELLDIVTRTREEIARMRR